MKVCLDAGHGGHDTGAYAPPYIEKDMTLITTKACKETLQAHGIEVIMTRTSDVYVGLGARASYSNNNKADLFVSIHYNAAAGNADGSEAIHSIHSQKGKALASDILDAITRYTGQNKRPKPLITKTLAKNPNKDFFAVVRETNCVSCIIEPAFINNPTDVFILNTVEKQKAMGVYIARGIMDYLGVKYSVTASSSPKNGVKSNATVSVADKLNVRSAATTDSKVIDFLYNGDRVFVVEKVNEWFKINNVSNGNVQSAYVHSKYVSLDGGATVTENAQKSSAIVKDKPIEVVKKGKVTASNLHVRKGPATKEQSLFKLNYDCIVHILDDSKEWYKIEVLYNGKMETGYAYGKYIAKI